MVEQLNKQKLFREMLIGTLIYSVVIGFFNDYTNVIDTKSYSITFSLALVLQFLTLITIFIKNKVVNYSKNHTGNKAKAILVLGVWVISFFSKFIFLWVIGIIFGDSVEIEGFVNIFLIVLVMLAIQKIVEFIDKSLGD
jgi:F0F1-type ATP synthase membrane subunit a